MASNYRIEVEVEIVKCDDEENTTPIQQGDGRFTCVLTEAQAVCIDTCEQAVLATDSVAVRDALGRHFSASSLERVQAFTESPDEVHVEPYRVDGEAGRITFDAHCVERDGAVVYDTTKEMFAPLGPKEWYRTQGFKELAFVYGVVDDSYRKISALINRVRHQEQDGTPLRTLWDNAEAEGQQLQSHVEQLAAATLEEHAFTPEGAPSEVAAYQNQAMVTLPAEQVSAAIHECAPQPEWVAEMESNPVAYEYPAHSVSVAIDDVGVKQQKAPRERPSTATPELPAPATVTLTEVATAEDLSTATPEPPAPEEKKRVHHTVARVAQGASAYILTGQGVANVLRLVVAFLLHNHLLQHNLIFFADGQRSLHTAVLRVFAWFKPIQIILDWYHLMEKCKQQLSLALKGRAIRNQVLAALRPLLWHGCVDRAISTLRAIPADQIKNQKALDDSIGYLERNRPHIPCYSVRKKLGLRNSSQAGEKANDLVVSSRQKHNGMSWRLRGSAALAAITTMVKNREHRGWFRDQSLAFSFAA